MSPVTVTKVATLTGHRDSVYALEAVPQSTTFFSGAGDGMIVQWNLGSEDGEAIAQLGASIYALRYDTTTGLLLAGHNFEGLRVIDWRARKEVGSLKFTSSAIFDLVVTGTHAWAAGGDGVLSVVDLKRLQVVNTVSRASQSARCMAVRPGKNEIAVGYSDNHIRIFDSEDLSLIKEYPAHANSVFCLRYTADGRRLLSGSRDARLKAWAAEEGYRLQQEVAAHLFAINDIGFSPDGKHFVTCSMDKSVKVWRTEDLNLLKVIDKARHAGHGTSVNKVLWSPVTHQVVSASDDRTLSIWDVIF